MGIYCISFRSRYANRYPLYILEVSCPKLIKNIGQPNSNPNFSKNLVPWAKNNGRWPISTSEVLSVTQILNISEPNFKWTLEFLASLPFHTRRFSPRHSEKCFRQVFTKVVVCTALRSQSFPSQSSKKTVCVDKRDRSFCFAKRPRRRPVGEWEQLAGETLQTLLLNQKNPVSTLLPVATSTLLKVVFSLKLISPRKLRLSRSNFRFETAWKFWN